MNLAVRYRPKTFAEVVSQEHVTRTLERALTRDMLARAYLLAGPRGSGKTTVARLVAAALNCEKEPSERPCGECSQCTDIQHGRSLDTIEIDGASNRGIDEIRELREQCRYLPARSRFKTYIIDEVHMLTTEAFNALLKTLEEPPEHVHFLFATTDPERIPETVQSRTHRFDFRPVPTSDIVGRLSHVVKAEGLEVEAGALELLAQHAEGSIRDALMSLEQLVVFSDGVATLTEARELLGVVSLEFYSGLFEDIHKSDLKGAVQRVEGLFREGHTPSGFVRGLLSSLGGLLRRSLGLAGPETPYTPQDVLVLLNEAIRLSEALRYNPAPEPFIDATLARMCMAPSILDLKELVNRFGLSYFPEGGPKRTDAKERRVVPTPEAGMPAPQTEEPGREKPENVPPKGEWQESKAVKKAMELFQLKEINPDDRGK